MGREAVVGKTGDWALEEKVGYIAIDGVCLRFCKHSVGRGGKIKLEKGGEIASELGGKGGETRVGVYPLGN